MIFTDLARAGLFATIPLAYAFDALSMEQLYVVAFAAGTMTVLFSVSYASLFIAVVEREHYVTATSWLAGSRAFSFVAGPSLGGILVQALKAPFALHRRLRLVPLLGAVPRHDLTRGAADGGGRARPRPRRDQLRAPQPDDALLAARDGDDQPLQLRLLGDLHPLRGERPRRERGHARARPRRRRGRRPDRVDRSRRD